MLMQFSECGKRRFLLGQPALGRSECTVCLVQFLAQPFSFSKEFMYLPLSRLEGFCRVARAGRILACGFHRGNSVLQLLNSGARDRLGLLMELGPLRCVVATRFLALNCFLQFV